METDRHYFIEGLFVIGLAIAAALFFVWLTSSGHRDDVPYRMHFSESVSGLALGDPVKYRGVDVGTVTRMAIDPDDPRLVEVDVNLRKDTPVRADTGDVPEIPTEKSKLATILDQLPKVIEKFSAIEDQSKRVLSDAGHLTARLKENPSLLIFPQKEKETFASPRK